MSGCQEIWPKPCRNKARWRVVTVGWTMDLCGTHARPYRRDAERSRFAYHDEGKPPPGLVSVTVLEVMG